MTWGRVAADERLANMAAALADRGSDAALAATKQLALIVRRQAEVMALADVVLALTAIFLGCVVLAAFMRKPAAAGGPARATEIAPPRGAAAPPIRDLAACGPGGFPTRF